MEKKKKGREQAKDEKKERGAKILLVALSKNKEKRQRERERERCVGGKRDVIEVVGRQNPSLIHHETDASGHSRSQAQSINT